MLERFTEATREAVVLAADEARTLGHDHIGTEHLLLGLVRQGDPEIARLGLTMAGLRTDVRVAVGAGSGGRTLGELQFTRAARRTLDAAEAAAPADGATPGDLLSALLGDSGSGASALVGRDADEGDLLLSMVRGDGIAAQALMSLGVDYERLERAIELVRRR